MTKLTALAAVPGTLTLFLAVGIGPGAGEEIAVVGQPRPADGDFHELIPHLAGRHRLGVGQRFGGAGPVASRPLGGREGLERLFQDDNRLSQTTG